MDETARKILETFDRLSVTRLRASDFSVTAGDAARDAGLNALVKSGCLREIGGQYERTEWGRLEIAGSNVVTFLHRPGCHLCEIAFRQLEPQIGESGAELRVVNVDTDQTLRERYGYEVPVVFLGNRELDRNRIDPRKVQAELARLSPKTPDTR